MLASSDATTQDFQLLLTFLQHQVFLSCFRDHGDQISVRQCSLADFAAAVVNPVCIFFHCMYMLTSLLDILQSYPRIPAISFILFHSYRLCNQTTVVCCTNYSFIFGGRKTKNILFVFHSGFIRQYIFDFYFFQDGVRLLFKV